MHYSTAVFAHAPSSHELQRKRTFLILSTVECGAHPTMIYHYIFYKGGKSTATLKIVKVLLQPIHNLKFILRSSYQQISGLTVKKI
jgi:hypothetical protein